METIQNISQFKDRSLQTVVTIGTFDGVHFGHRKILERITSSAKKTGLKSTVLTFFPHPRMVLQKDVDIKLLNTLEEKIQILETLGLDYLVVHPFTREFSRLGAEQYVRDILVDGLGAQRVIIGYDHRFGRNRNASIEELVAYGRTFGFEVEEIPAQEVEDVSVSSTKIRMALEAGDIETANAYLSYAYLLTGKVAKGKGLGRDFGFPTANLQIAESYKQIPKNGSYVVRSRLGGREVHGMMNIGFNPTVDGSKKSIEVHFFDFMGDLYGQKIQLQLLHRIRDEQKFGSIEDLKLQLKKDRIHAMELIDK